MILIEDDTDCETNYGDDSYPSLRGLDHHDRVIYVADVAKVLTPGTAARIHGRAAGVHR